MYYSAEATAALVQWLDFFVFTATGYFGLATAAKFDFCRIQAAMISSLNVVCNNSVLYSKPSCLIIKSTPADSLYLE